jgi:CubicO group peptidase (beta-lactamase class C family)
MMGALVLIVLISAYIFYPKYKMVQFTRHLFDEDRIVYNFRNFDKVWSTKKLTRSNSPYEYAHKEEMQLPESFKFDGKNYTTTKYLQDSWTTGFLVIQNDTIAYENYFLGNTESTRNISWSMAKSFISTLIGIAKDEGYIPDLMATVDSYLPSLKGSGYEGVRIKDVLQMSTGVKFNEDYGDPDSDINRWGRDFALGNSQDAFAATLEREIEPGTVNHYVSINTHVLGMLLTKATGRTITDYMQEKLWDPLGMEYNGYWLADSYNMEMALGGLNATMRDYAKIGSLFLHQGNWNGNQIVSKEWIVEAVTPDAPHVMPSEEFGYGYQWWIPKSTVGEFMAIGVYNQNIYINPSTNTIVVKLSANPKFNDEDFVPSKSEANLELYRAIANQLNQE